MKDHKIVISLDLILSNLVLFCCIHKLFFSTNIIGFTLNSFISLSCLNFAFLTAYNSRIFEKKNLWYIFSEWIFGFILISFFTKFFFIRSSEYQLTYWTAVICASILGGFITTFNYNKTFNANINLKKYIINLILLTLFFPLINYVFYNFLYNKVFYDLSFYVIFPEIIIILSWQILTFLSIKKGQQVT